jgi:hypothetical protein
LSSVYSEYHSLAVCPNCGFEFEAPRHGLKGEGAHYVIDKINDQHRLILTALSSNSGGMTLTEVYKRVIELCDQYHLPYITKGSVAGRLSEMANPAIGLVREFFYLGKWYYSPTEDGRKMAAMPAVWQFDNIEEEPAKNPNIEEANIK